MQSDKVIILEKFLSLLHEPRQFMREYRIKGGRSVKEGKRVGKMRFKLL